MQMKNFNYESLKSNNGVSIRPKNLAKNYPSEYQDILNYMQQNNLQTLPFSEVLFMYFHKYNEQPKCKHCKKNILKFESYNAGYITTYCSHLCMSHDPELNLTKEETRLKKYGVRQIGQSKEIKDKIAKTNIKKYGVDNVFKRKDYQNKVTETIMKKYGVKTILQLPENKLKAKESIKNNPPKRNYEKVRQIFKEKYDKVDLINYIGKNIEFYCDCEKKQVCCLDRGLFRHRYLNDIKICNHCNPVGVQNSFGEQELTNYVKSLLGDNILILENNRTLIKPYELDLYVPSLNLAIEYDGLFWHNEKKVGREYHLNKTTMCESKGVRLLHVFEDEWRNKKETVKYFLKSIISPSTVSPVPDYKIVTLDKSTANTILFQNTILDYTIEDINYGIEINNEIVGVMCFKQVGQLKYELITNTHQTSYDIKLFETFLNDYKPKQVVAFADRRYYTKNQYCDLGFELDGEIPPDYYYLTKESGGRFAEKIQKNQIENYERRKYSKIFDCGKYKFIWNKNK